MTEANNTLSQPTGAESQFSVGEGKSRLLQAIDRQLTTFWDDLLLATPAPHPSEAPIQSPNPLATTPVPRTAGTELSILSLSSRVPIPQLYKVSSSTSDHSGSNPVYDPLESLSEPRTSIDTEGGGRASLEGASNSNNGGSKNGGYAPAFGEGNSSLRAVGGKKDTVKRVKPKNNIIKSNSSFISRVITHDAINKHLADRGPDDVFAFANINRAFQWLDLSSASKHDYLTKILFTKAHALCHDANVITRSSTHLDVIIGFSTGDIMWYEPISQKYARLNKNGTINSSAISQIRWIPGSENLFLAAHVNGSLVVYDKEKEDAPFIPEGNGALSSQPSSNQITENSLHVSKSVNSKNQKFNPVACWTLLKQPINDLAFSPDSKHLAVVSEDGTLRIIDYLKEQMTSSPSGRWEKGELLPVAKGTTPGSPQSLLTPGDAMIEITGLAASARTVDCFFGILASGCYIDQRRYGSKLRIDMSLRFCGARFLILATQLQSSARQRRSDSSQGIQRTRTESQATNRLRSNSNVTSTSGEDEQVVNHPVESRALTAVLPPVMSKTVDPDPLCWLEFREDCIITSSTEGAHIIINVFRKDP
ncbi:hypothetical protein FGG08_000657 [Glutinoglossum americanum]|uniref:Catabolite repression protein creC n=1 Tax=Glutinoglossum americanum TaxID=1670608 RepID=A0A9P8L0Z8_9PEZI|nr:hypothetical protein FGG08_000657 [Glutinoglossum americanum]